MLPGKAGGGTRSWRPPSDRNRPTLPSEGTRNATTPTPNSVTGTSSSTQPTTVLFSSRYATTSLDSSGAYPSFSRAIGTVLLTIVISPPPTSFFDFTSEKSGSTPVVSQSIMKLIVPVGASTVACAFR